MHGWGSGFGVRAEGLVIMGWGVAIRVQGLGIGDEG